MIYKIKYIKYFNISPNGADSNAAASVKNNYGNRVLACLRRSARQRETSPGTVRIEAAEKYATLSFSSTWNYLKTLHKPLLNFQERMLYYMNRKI